LEPLADLHALWCEHGNERCVIVSKAPKSKAPKAFAKFAKLTSFAAHQVQLSGLPCAQPANADAFPSFSPAVDRGFPRMS
jgi:hypothetical protein